MRTSLLSYVFAFLFAHTAAAQTVELSVAATEYPPFYGAEIEDNGFVSVIVAAAFERSGYEPNVDFLPWPRAFESARQGRYDAIYTMWYRAEREEDFLYSDPLVANEVVFFSHVDTVVESTDFADLAGLTIGLVRGYAPPPGFEEAGLELSFAANDAENLRKLVRGRVDLVLIDRILAQHLLNTELSEHASDLVYLSPPVSREPQFLAVPRSVEDAEEILAGFNIGLNEIRADGTLDGILERFGFVDQ